MYGRFGAPEDKEKKKQGAAGGAIANGNANADRHMRRVNATDDRTLEKLKKRQRKIARVVVVVIACMTGETMYLERNSQTKVCMGVCMNSTACCNV
ncbi:BZ3500_MvSof-1268-A1-R1_Chr5-2g07758 [Microbotryum saponariae]|uniref:BZ3500_MvSof-1268-A1-R1_Chr5-2g07758 protein n=1 Tax=Microbotryum saponariae TaxID=289078 RepID=A0A2X0NJR2_9BASI|nr:BZ3500_MvSof-1268-A1-R1_Chr5-2g07758 [Microbotryum saponariae]SDA05627.1 BZ3501_MvSof-1269-A2-R1_Chr5-2g07580 [Microbotryum saponariae]